VPVESVPGTFQDFNAAVELVWWKPHAGLVLAGTSFASPSKIAHYGKVLSVLGREEWRKRRQISAKPKGSSAFKKDILGPQPQFIRVCPRTSRLNA
jgi:hypothetical protein